MTETLAIGPASTWDDARTLVADVATRPTDGVVYVLDGLTSAGRDKFLAQVRADWTARRIVVLDGRAPTAPADTLEAALYDAVLGSSRGSDRLDRVLPGLPIGEDPRTVAPVLASLARSAAGVHRFVVVLRGVNLGTEWARTLAADLAGELAKGAPPAVLVLNPVGVAPVLAGSIQVLSVPPSQAPHLVQDRSDRANLLHGTVRQALQELTGDRQLMLDVILAWRRAGQIRLVDRVWMPTGPLIVPELDVAGPAAEMLGGLSGTQDAVVSVLAFLNGCRQADLPVVLGVGAAAVAAAVQDLRRTKIVEEVPTSRTLQVADPLLRAAAAASVGPAQRALWSARTGATTPGAPRSQAPGPALPTLEGRLDGEEVVNAARLAVAADASWAGGAAALAAVVLCHRGRFDRARAWLELEVTHTDRGADDPVAIALLHWAEAEVDRLGSRSAVKSAGRTGTDDPRAAAAAYEAVLHAVREWKSGRPDMSTGWCEVLEIGLTQAARVAEVTAALAELDLEDAESAGVRELLAICRQGRFVLLWCKAAQWARAHGVPSGRPPAPPAPSGAVELDDVLRAVLSMLAAGLTTQAVAALLSMRRRAVEYRMQGLFTQVGATSRAQLVRAYVDGLMVDVGV